MRPRAAPNRAWRRRRRDVPCGVQALYIHAPEVILRRSYPVRTAATRLTCAYNIVVSRPSERIRPRVPRVRWVSHHGAALSRAPCIAPLVRASRRPTSPPQRNSHAVSDGRHLIFISWFLTPVHNIGRRCCNSNQYPMLPLSQRSSRPRPDSVARVLSWRAR